MVRERVAWCTPEEAQRVDRLIAAAKQAVSRQGSSDAWGLLSACVRDTGTVRWHAAEIEIRPVVDPDGKLPGQVDLLGGRKC